MGRDLDSGSTDTGDGGSHKFLKLEAPQTFAVKFALGNYDLFMNVFKSLRLSFLLDFFKFGVN